jgi:hypothetical protein
LKTQRNTIREYYIDKATGQQIDLDDAPTSVFLIQDANGDLRVQQWTGDDWEDAADQGELQYIYDQNCDDYYFHFADPYWHCNQQYNGFAD